MFACIVLVLAISPAIAVRPVANDHTALDLGTAGLQALSDHGRSQADLGEEAAVNATARRANLQLNWKCKVRFDQFNIALERFLPEMQALKTWADGFAQKRRGRSGNTFLRFKQACEDAAPKIVAIKGCAARADSLIINAWSQQSSLGSVPRTLQLAPNHHIEVGSEDTGIREISEEDWDAAVAEIRTIVQTLGQRSEGELGWALKEAVDLESTVSDKVKNKARYKSVVGDQLETFLTDLTDFAALADQLKLVILSMKDGGDCRESYNSGPPGTVFPKQLQDKIVADAEWIGGTYYIH